MSEPCTAQLGTATPGVTEPCGVPLEACARRLSTCCGNCTHGRARRAEAARALAAGEPIPAPQWIFPSDWETESRTGGSDDY